MKEKYNKTLQKLHIIIPIWFFFTGFSVLISLVFSNPVFFIVSLLIGIFLVWKQQKQLKNFIGGAIQIHSINNEIAIKKEELNEIGRFLNSEKQRKQQELDSFQTSINTQIIDLRKELNQLTTDTLIAHYNFSNYEGMTSEECKNELILLKEEQKLLISQNTALTVTSDATKREINNNMKQAIRCFNSECDNIISAITSKNIDSLSNKILRSFSTLNTIFQTDGIKISSNFLRLKFEELDLVYAISLKKEKEREIQREIKAQIVEEEKVRREIERAKQKIEKEESQFKNEINKLMAYMQKASDIEKQLYIDKIRELENKVKLLELDKENVLEREQNTRAGFVYVISNIGSFGENIYKIGMTRRLEPMDRIAELGSASVPFKFDVHAMIFSEDAPTLETTLHHTFKQYEVNKVNSRKEFFKIDLQHVEKIVKQYHNSTVNFNLFAEASEYRESLTLEAEQHHIQAEIQTSLLQAASTQES